MHSFIDPAKLTIQNPTDTFGVDSSDPINKFNITSRFQLVDVAKAFACQDGMIIVQQSELDDSLVNVIIKPIESLKVNFNNIKYFVYRGIEKKSLLIDKDKVALEESTNNEFIARLWKNHKQYKIDFKLPKLPDPSPKVFGYTDSLPNNLNIEKIFDNSQEEIRALFVKQGEWFGDFTTTHKIGFEIVTSSDRINIDLAYLKKEYHQIDVTNLVGLELRAKKEEILSFIDPAAFFGLHYDVGVNISTNSGGQKTTVKKKKKELFDLLIEKFATKNRVYLDIRSEFGYSYNFYQNYNDGIGKNIKIGNSTTTPIAEIYGILGNGWPIIAIDNPMNTSNNFNDIVFQLRIDDNTKPILFLEYTELLSNGSRVRFFDETKLLDGISTNWSKEIKLKFPNVGNGTSKNNVAYYMRLYYYKQETNSSSPNTLITKENQLDHLFGSIDMLYLGDTTYSFQNSSNEHPIYSKGEIYSQPFNGVFRQNANFDTLRVVFTTEMLFSYKTSGMFYPDTKIGRGNGIDLEGNFNKISHLKRYIYHSVSTIQEEVSLVTYEPIKILGISNYNGFPSRRENLYILGLMQNELNKLKNVTGLSKLHNRFIVFEEVSPTPAEDKNGKSYKKYRLKIKGLDNNGIGVSVAPASDVFVYTSDNFMFCSKGFAENEPLGESLFYARNYEEKIGFENREPTTNKRYEDWFIEKDSGMKVEVEGFINALSQINNDSDFYRNVKTLVEDSAEDIWNQAVSSVQANNNANPDDRPLYWARIKMQVALKSHSYFNGGINNTDLNKLIVLFEEKSRNFTGVDFLNAPAGAKKILITGFDPFFLKSNKEQWNPSGQAVLSLHGKTLGNGFIQSMIFPVRYIDFDNGYVEKYILEHIQDVDMIITISQGRNRYDIERFASKFRTSSTIDNLNVVLPHKFYLPSTKGISQVNESVIPEFLVTTLPINTMIPGSLGNTFVVYNQEYIGDKTSAPYSSPNSGTSNITGPNTTEKAIKGSGGTYLSNEIFYRVAVLRNHLGLNNTLKSGHLHVPNLSVNDLAKAQIHTLNVKTIIQDAIQGL